MSFRVRRIYDDFLPSNKRAIDQIIEMTKMRVADLPEDQFEQMRGLFRNPIYRRMRYLFFIADDEKGDVKGFAQMSFAPDLHFSFLDLLVTRKKKKEGGMGNVLYERVREEARYLKSRGLFIECMTDDGRVFKDRRMLKENRSRLKFYEQYGARPIDNTEYEQHTRIHYSNPYFLLYDDLDQQMDLGLEDAKKIVKAILQRKYENQRKRDINVVLRSMKDDPVQLRDMRYRKVETVHHIKAIPDDRKIILVTSDGHEIHHVRERGYVESPVRIRLIQNELEKTHLFVKIKTRHYAERYIKEVHENEFVDFFKRVSLAVEPGKTLYPDVFPIRKIVKPPKGLVSRAGYYCTDIYSPINRNSYIAARAAVNTALTGAEQILRGTRIAYALVRPPGHHADSTSFGGFCYFNSTAVAAQYLSRYGKVAILDLDYHHGNGQQDIFYLRKTVLTVSIHADPDFEYPHFSGFRDEVGKGDGEDFNINYPLPAGMTGTPYHRTLKRAVRAIRRFDPDFLVLALGFDTAKGDPTGTWKLVSADFKVNGRIIGSLGLPTLVVQEGGYNTRMLGINARNFFTGLWEGMYDR